MIRIKLCGGFQNRNPFAYEPFLNHLTSEIALVDEAEDADLLLISHPMDLELSSAEFAMMLAQQKRLRLVLLSEEPFWDTGWGRDPFCRDLISESIHGSFTCRVISHQTTTVFKTSHLPYFLLTDPRYIAHYRPLFDYNAGMSVAGWLAHFRSAEIDAAFFSERRLAPRDRITFAASDVWGLSWYRTRFAERCRKGHVLRAGKGWGDDPPRQSLPDWHADKLTRLNRRCRYLGAFENTHQADYISEKIFDAFAVGAMPLYFAAENHAVHQLIEPGSWLNFYATPPRAPAFDARRPVSLAEAEAYAAAQIQLAKTMCDLAATESDLDRICKATLKELRAALASR